MSSQDSPGDESRVAIAVEHERQQIAAEIHDGLLPYLYATAAKLSHLRRVDDQLNATLEEVADWVDRSRQIARDLMNTISYPETVADDPLRAAQEFIDDVIVRSGMAVAAEAGQATAGDHAAPDEPSRPRIVWSCLSGDPPRSQIAGCLDEPTGVAVYRIVCELVRNAVRHANATQIVVRADRTDHGIEIEVRDDGSGFNPNRADETARHGLDWIQGRAKWVGWHLRIESSDGRGTIALLSGTTDA